MGWQNAFAVLFQAGNTLVVNGKGMFLYNGAVAENALIASLTAAEVRDTKGNLALQGLTAYGLAGTTFWAINLGFGISFYSALSEPGPWNLQANIGATPQGDLLITPEQNTQITGAVQLAAETEPPSLAGFSTVYGDSAGNLDFVSGGDNNQYSTGRCTLSVPSTVDINTGTTPITILTQQVEGGVLYRYHFVMVYVGQQSAGTPSFELSGTATPSKIVGKAQFQGAASGTISNSQVTNGTLNVFTGPTMVSGGTFACEGEGIAKFSDTGTFTIRGFTSATADTYEVAIGSYFEIMPVTS